MLHRLNAVFPVRYSVFALCGIGWLLSALTQLAFGQGGWWFPLCLLLAGVGLYDVVQTKSSILRNYPVIGHLRFMLEFVRPELRQYFLESDIEATPLSRAQRSLVYQRAKGEPDNRPLGTQRDGHAEGYEWMNHSIAPSTLAAHHFRVWIGGTPDEVAPRGDGDGAWRGLVQQRTRVHVRAGLIVALSDCNEAGLHCGNKEKYGTLLCTRISLEQVSRACSGADSLHRASGLPLSSHAARVRLGCIRA